MIGDDKKAAQRAAQRERDELMARANRLCAQIYSCQPDHAAGGCWHVVLDDGNVEDRFIEFTYGYAAASHRDEPNHPCLEMVDIMRRLSKTQRLKVRCDYSEILGG